jgi:uncharacterized repeat protein (TIGR01451 family)
MSPRRSNHRVPLALGAALCALIAGCASLPRIDPTGERCLIWPKDQPQAAPLVVPGNVTAPPVGTDAVFPAPVAAAPAVAAPAVVPATVALSPGNVDRLTMSPERVLAPVGSEVVLKTSICTADGYTLADQKIEWMLGRNGVGQFVELGGKGLFHPPLLPFLRGTKVDNYLARGYTANGPLCITRGTADPLDDVNINRGDAWITVTSPSEGTSYVTAYTPEVETWNERKATATIYWVDVQWTFPPAAVNSNGRAEQLTTLVTRQTDGTPLAGWVVRYTVADGGTIGGAPSAQNVEMATNAEGRATVEVAPTASGAASSRIDMELIRPAGFGAGDAPKLVVARGSTIVNWSSSIPYDSPTTPPITTTPPATAPPATIPATPTTPSQPGTPLPIPPMTTAPAKLEVRVNSDTTATVNGTVNTSISVKNVGGSPATGIKILDVYPAELSSPADPQRNLQIEAKLRSNTLAPNEEKQLPPLSFNVIKAGRHCQTITVTYDQGPPVVQQTCVTATDAAPTRQAAVDVTMTGPAQMAVGETREFIVTVKNPGPMALVNIDVTEEYPTQFMTATPTAAGEQAVSGVIRHRIDRLDAGQVREFRTRGLATQATSRARPLVSVVAQSDPPTAQVTKAAEVVVQIGPPTGAAPPAGANPAANSGLSVRVGFALPQPSIQAGARTTCEVTVSNLAPVADGNVALKIVFPAGVTPDVTAIQGPPGVSPQLRGNELTFTPLATLGPKEQVLYRIPINTTAPGAAEIVAGVYSRNAPTVTSNTGKLEIVGGRRL